MELKEQLKELAQKLIDADTLVNETETAFKAAKRARDLVTQMVIPEALDNLGVTEFTIDTGERLVVEDKTTASPPERTRAAAMEWLDANGHGAMIKTTVLVMMDRQENDAAKELYQKLSGEYPLTNFISKVEPMTLSSWARGMLERDEEFPHELFGLHEVRKASLKKAKKTKKK